MYTGYIVKANETAEDSRVAQAIVNLGLSGQDVICVAYDGFVNEVETLLAAKQIVGDSSITTIEEAMEKLIALKNGEIATAEEKDEALTVLGVDINA